MKRFILGFACLLSGCNFGPDAIVGSNRLADQATPAQTSYSCALMNVGNSTPSNGAACADPSLPMGTVMTTEGDDGGIVLYVSQLSDGSYPTVPGLQYQATEATIVSGVKTTSQYPVIFTCTAGAETPAHLLPYHCVPQDVPRLRSKPQAGEATVVFDHVMIENPACGATETYTLIHTTCYSGIGYDTSLEFQPPDLGLAPAT